MDYSEAEVDHDARLIFDGAMSALIGRGVDPAHALESLRRVAIDSNGWAAAR